MSGNSLDTAVNNKQNKYVFLPHINSFDFIINFYNFII